jgi:hypothetical protein
MRRTAVASAEALSKRRERDEMGIERESMMRQLQRRYNGMNTCRNESSSVVADAPRCASVSGVTESTVAPSDSTSQLSVQPTPPPLVLTPTVNTTHTERDEREDRPGWSRRAGSAAISSRRSIASASGTTRLPAVAYCTRKHKREQEPTETEHRTEGRTQAETGSNRERKREFRTSRTYVEEHVACEQRRGNVPCAGQSRQGQTFAHQQCSWCQHHMHKVRSWVQRGEKLQEEQAAR